MVFKFASYILFVFFTIVASAQGVVRADNFPMRGKVKEIKHLKFKVDLEECKKGKIDFVDRELMKSKTYYFNEENKESGCSKK
ncbi:MAG: hypothetical protein AAFZ15_30210 [Bacteroidota bacterium]